MNYYIELDEKSELDYNAWIMYHKDEICDYIEFILHNLGQKKLVSIMDCGSDEELFEKISHIIYRYSHKGRPLFKNK